VIPIDIYDYDRELKLLKSLPKDGCIGLVSISSGILRAGEVLIYSLRGEELLVMTAQAEDTHKVSTLVRRAQTIWCDQASHGLVKSAIQSAREDLIRPPQIFCSENYIGTKSINLLKRELGLE